MGTGDECKRGRYREERELSINLVTWIISCFVYILYILAIYIYILIHFTLRKKSQNLFKMDRLDKIQSVHIPEVKVDLTFYFQFATFISYYDNISKI